MSLLDRTSKFARYNVVHILVEFGPHGDIAYCGFTTDRAMKVPAETKVDCERCLEVWHETEEPLETQCRVCGKTLSDDNSDVVCPGHFGGVS